MAWVMTERKAWDGRVYDVGDEAPAALAGKPYTREKIEEQQEQRVEDPAPNRMLRPETTQKRKSARRAK